MIKIGKPYKEKNGEFTYLKSEIKDGDGGYHLWYSVPSEYSCYLTDEIADAFLLNMLMPAMKTGQDILVEAPVSPRLLFHINETIMKMFEKVLPGSKCVNITCKTNQVPFFNAKSVGVGCSLGVDSFSSILRLMESNCVPEYKITHLCFFNIGSFGDNDLEKANEEYEKNVRDLIPFSREIGIPLLGINSNVSYPYTVSGVDVTQSFIPRTISAVLVMQKLFGKYAFASSHTPEHFEFSPFDVSKIESALVPILSTDNTEILLADTMTSRVEKTRYIADNIYVQKYLDVCWARLFYNRWKGSTLLEKKQKKNCGMCEKCMRTLLTIELIGLLDKYQEIFDLEAYRRYRSRFIGKVLWQKSTKAYYEEIYNLMKEKNFQIPFLSKLISFGGKIGLVRLYYLLTGKTGFAK